MLGTIQGRRLVILIDGGAQRTIFLAKVIAEELQHPIAFTAAYGVRLGDGKISSDSGAMQRGSPHFARSGGAGGLHTYGAWEYQCDP